MSNSISTLLLQERLKRLIASGITDLLLSGPANCHSGESFNRWSTRPANH